MKLYKVLNRDGTPCHGGTGRWSLPHDGKPGKWMPAVAVDPCCSGYHLCRLRDLPLWLGPAILTVEARGTIVDCPDKIVAAEARLL